MAHRIEVELPSRTGDATWTWRAAGAKQPRGSVEAALVPDGAGEGTVLRADIETTLDGTVVTALTPVKGKAAGSTRPSAQRIEVTGTPNRGPDVNVVLSPKSKRSRDDRPGGGADRGRRPADRRPRRSDSENGRRDEAEGSETSESRGRGRRAPTGPGDEGKGPRRRGPARPGTREAGTRESSRRPAPSTTFRNAALAELKP